MKDRIFQFMKQQGMSQKQFASELCVAEATLSSIFTGRTRPTNALVAAIHERFPEVSISWPMFGEGDMYAGEYGLMPKSLSGGSSSSGSSSGGNKSSGSSGSGSSGNKSSGGSSGGGGGGGGGGFGGR